jgi:hypothetical protein
MQSYREWKCADDWVMVDDALLDEEVRGWTPSEKRQWRREEGRRWLKWGSLPSTKDRSDVEAMRLRIGEAVDTDLRRFPRRISELPHLQYLSMPLGYAGSLSTGSLPPSVETLEFNEQDYWGSSKKGTIPDDAVFPSVKRISCSTGEIHFTRENFPKLSSVNICLDRKRSMVPELLRFKRMEELNVGPFDEPEQLEELSSLRPRYLGVSGGGLRTLRPLHTFRGVDRLVLHRLHKLTNLSGIEGLARLKELRVAWCRNLADISDAESLASATSFELFNCPKVVGISAVGAMERLRSFELMYCSGVRDLRPILRASRLRKLWIVQCTGIDLVSVAHELIAMGLDKLAISGKKYLHNVDGEWDSSEKGLIFLPKAKR